jgi:hypothetical protein
MAPLGASYSLVNDGDSIHVATTLTLNSRSSSGINTLNTQLRFGLFNGPSGAVGASDIPNLGYIIEYTNQAAGGLIREQANTTQTNPFNSPTNIGNGSQDSGVDSIQGANPGPVTFNLTLTRQAGQINLAGSISGTDSVSGNAYLANYAVNGYTPTIFPANSAFTFNRIGLFLGDGVNASTAVLSNTSVSAVPESPWCVTAAVACMGTLVGTRRVLRRRA